jgi:hypothetical protein
MEQIDQARELSSQKKFEHRMKKNEDEGFGL